MLDPHGASHSLGNPDADETQDQNDDDALCPQELAELLHDLRNPLTSLRLGLETLQEVVHDPDIGSLVGHLLSDVDRLSDLLDERDIPASKEPAAH